jgi:steroid delta-isomerase-like uncharacterized protein
MSTENKESMRRFFDEVVNGGDVALIDELLAADFVEHEEFPGLAGGREGTKQFFTLMRTAFPDLRVDLDDLIAEGDKVVARSSMSGTHKAEFMGMAPTGSQFRVSVIDVVRFSGGKAVEHWGVTDTAGMMEQLGVVPATSS